jgi:hypothetical protein
MKGSNYIYVAVILGIYVCGQIKENYLSKKMKDTLNNVKRKEREGKLWVTFKPEHTQPP